jgi:CO/xanthine dehydrogenase Mo-binding subunit
VAIRSGTFAAGPYVIPNAKVDVYAVYTNQPPGGAMRGFGSPQVAFAGESQMDRLAREIGIDPLEMRQINALEPGKVTITGHRLGGGVGLKECLAAIKHELDNSPLPEPAPGKKVGVGVACAYKNVGLGGGYDERIAAWMDLQPDGTVRLRVGCTDNGQGSDSAMAQIAAQASGLSYDLIRVQASDTAETPDAGVTTGSRMIFLSGNACLGVGRAFADEIKRIAAAELAVDPEAIAIVGDRVVARDQGQSDGGGSQGPSLPSPSLTDPSLSPSLDSSLPSPSLTDPSLSPSLDSSLPSTSLSLADLASRLAARGQQIQAKYTYEPPKTHPVPERAASDPADPSENRLHFSYCFGAQAAVVEVDERDGSVKVLKLIAAHDLGRIVNPIGAEGQVEGGAMMGLGYALSEEFRCREGKIETDNLARLRLPKITELPDLTTILIEDVDPNGPYGAKGMSELPVSPTAPAVCSAIYDAVGVRLTALPATKEKVKALLDGRGA